MEDDDRKTIEHNPAEPTPENRKLGNRIYAVCAVVVVCFWAYYIAAKGFDWLDWEQIALGFATCFVLYGWVMVNTDPNKPYLDHFKRDGD